MSVNAKYLLIDVIMNLKIIFCAYSLFMAFNHGAFILPETTLIGMRATTPITFKNIGTEAVYKLRSGRLSWCGRRSLGEKYADVLTDRRRYVFFFFLKKTN